MPLISPITFYLVVVNMVFAFFGSFGVIHAVTQGGPGSADRASWSSSCGRTASSGSNLGSSAAQSVLLMSLVIGLTMLQFRFVERRVTYS